MNLRWPRFLIILPIVTLCVSGHVKRGGIEYHGTSNVRVQKPIHQLQSHRSLSTLTSLAVTTPKQSVYKEPLHPQIHTNAQPSIEETSEIAVLVASAPQQDREHSAPQRYTETENQSVTISLETPAVSPSKLSTDTSLQHITSSQKPVNIENQSAIPFSQTTSVPSKLATGIALNLITTSQKPEDLTSATSKFDSEPTVTSSAAPAVTSPKLSLNVSLGYINSTKKPLEITSQASLEFQNKPSVASLQPTTASSFELSKDATLNNITISLKPVTFISQTSINFKHETVITASESSLVVVPEISAPPRSLPSTTTTLRPPIETSPELSAYDTPSHAVALSQTASDISPPVITVLKLSEPLIAPGSVPPAKGLAYPLKPLPSLLPEPKPIRRPEFIRYTQPTAVYPSTYISQTTIQYVTEPTNAASKFRVPIRTPPKQSGSWNMDFNCNQGNGFYGVENECDAYIECKESKPLKFICPDSLHFNSAAKWSEYPCVYPSVAKCITGIENQNPKPTTQCPRQYGFFTMNDGDCSKYIMCQNGIPIIMNCPAGLAFNPVTDSCDWQVNVPQCNPNVFKGFSCPEAPLDRYGYVSNIISKFRYQNQCKLYIACQKGYPRLLSCDRGLAFDENTQSCINANYVANCSTATLYKLSSETVNNLSN